LTAQQHYKIACIGRFVNVPSADHTESVHES